MADHLIEQGRVNINGHTAVAGAKVQDGDVVTVEGSVVTLPHERDRVYIAFNKPVGITSVSYTHLKRRLATSPI